MFLSDKCFPPHYVIYLCLIGAGFLAGLARYNQKKAVQPVIILLGLTFFSEFLSKVLACEIKNNSIVYHFYHPIQAALWGVFFYINMRSILRRTVIPLSILLLASSILNTIFLQNTDIFPGNFVKLECIVLLFWSFCLFFEFIDKPISDSIFNDSRFIICIAVIWFNLVSYLFFVLFNYYVTQPKPVFSIRGIHYFSNYTYYSLLLLAMFLKCNHRANDR